MQTGQLIPVIVGNKCKQIYLWIIFAAAVQFLFPINTKSLKIKEKYYNLLNVFNIKKKKNYMYVK